MKLIKKHQKGSKLNKPLNFEKFDYYSTHGLYGDDYHERAQKFLGVKDPESYVTALHNWNFEKKIIPEINRYYKNNPDAVNGPIDERKRIEGGIEYKYNKDVIIELQKRLKEIGLYDGQIDGIWGPKTEKAENDFNRMRDSRLRDLREERIPGLGFGSTKDNNYKPLFWVKK